MMLLVLWRTCRCRYRRSGHGLCTRRAALSRPTTTWTDGLSHSHRVSSCSSNRRCKVTSVINCSSVIPSLSMRVTNNLCHRPPSEVDWKHLFLSHSSAFTACVNLGSTSNIIIIDHPLSGMVYNFIRVLSSCLFVCAYYDNCRKPWLRKFIFTRLVYLKGIG